MLRGIALALATLLAVLALLEGAVGVALGRVERLHGPFRRALLGPLRSIHLAAEWPMVQLDPSCVRWDPELTYTLRPPGCTIADREFTVRYDANAAGLRDDAPSLDRPALIVVGDSVAMGWGVPAGDAFPAVVERTTGLRVLNAGVSSYGTAREMRLLARLDRSALRALVVQYCWNDNVENRRWRADGGMLPITPEGAWTALVWDHQRGLRYWPGKYLWTLVAAAFGAEGLGVGAAYAASAEDPAVTEAADDFVAVLRGHASLIGSVSVVVVPFCRRAHEVAAAIRTRAAATMPTLVVVEPRLGDAERFPLDGHPNAAGHATVAARLVETLERIGVTAR